MGFVGRSCQGVADFAIVRVTEISLWGAAGGEIPENDLFIWSFIGPNPLVATKLGSIPSHVRPKGLPEQETG